MSTYFNGKTVWITGASSGIGEALVMELAANTTAKIILSSRKEEQLEAIAQKAKLTSNRYAVLPWTCIIIKIWLLLQEKQQVNSEVLIFLLIMRACLSDLWLWKTDIEVDKRLIDIDYIGTVALTKATIPYMIRNGGGQIAVVSSLMGIFGAPMRSGYAGAKHALHGFFDALRAELYKENILITIICPGFIQTNISMNAVTGDGSSQGTMDEATQNGMPAPVFARKMLRAIEKKKYQKAIGGKEVLGVFLKDFSLHGWPGLPEKRK